MKADFVQVRRITKKGRFFDLAPRHTPIDIPISMREDVPQHTVPRVCNAAPRGNYLYPEAPSRGSQGLEYLDTLLLQARNAALFLVRRFAAYPPPA